MSGNETLYERLGGKAAISAVVDRFYERVLADESLAHFFDDADMQSLRAHQVQFFSAVTGGPVDYTGEDMREAHAHLDITHEHFGSVATHLQGTLDEFDVPDEEAGAVMDAVAGLKDDVVTA